MSVFAYIYEVWTKEPKPDDEKKCIIQGYVQTKSEYRNLKLNIDSCVFLFVCILKISALCGEWRSFLSGYGFCGM